VAGDAERPGPGRLEDPRRLYGSAVVAVAAGACVWLAGLLLLQAGGHGTGTWNAIWALAGASLLSSLVLPVPGVTAALLLSLRRDVMLGTFAVLGAAFGSTVGAGILLALGHTGRAHLRRRATHSRWARTTLEWSTRLARRWTYAGVAALLVPQFIPKLVVLYAAVLVRLRAVPFLASVFVGVALRNLLVLGAFALLP
jgi:hypothetical protein